MVQSILNDYYHIPLEDQKYFTFQNQYYYFSKNKMPDYYKHYLETINFPGFTPILNKHHHILSKGFILYAYTNHTLTLPQILQSMHVLSYASPYMQKSIYLKNSQIYISQENPLYLSCSTIGLKLFTEYINESIPLGYCHRQVSLESKEYMNPDNIIIHYIYHDLIFFYLNNTITLSTLKDIMSYYNIQDKHYLLMFCHMLIENTQIDMKKYREFYTFLKIKNPRLPEINWIKKWSG